MKNIIRMTAGFFISSIIMSAGSSSFAETYPSRPITLLVPNPAGSTADIVSRLVGNELASQLKQPVVVMNKPGAGGILATQALKSAAPDGYTIGYIGHGQMVVTPVIFASPGYTQKDITPLTILGTVANVLVLPQNSRFKNINELVAYAKANPGKVNFSSGGKGTSQHLTGAMFSQAAGIDVVHIPYAGAPRGVMAVLSGEVDFGFYNTSSVLPQIRNGQLKALAITSASRSALLPNLETMQEAGFKSFEASPWIGFGVPLGTPHEVTAKLDTALRAALKSDSVKKILNEQGIDVAPPLTSAEFAKFMALDLEKWRPIIKASGAVAE